MKFLDETYYIAQYKILTRLDEKYKTSYNRRQTRDFRKFFNLTGIMIKCNVHINFLKL